MWQLYIRQSIDHEDCTFDDQTFETQLGGQVIEYDVGQPIDYPDTIDFGVQDNIYEGGPDYNYGDEEQGWEESAGYDSY